MPSNKGKAAQDFVPVKEIRDGVVILKNGGLRSVIMASSINFALKSEDEKTAILLQFQDFLNSLDFSVQIVVQSRRLNIKPYIELLEERHKEQSNDLMRLQVEEYIEFIQNFTDHTNIMTKHFYVVVPYTPAFLQGKKGGGKGLLSYLFSKKDSGNATEKAAFEEHRTQLDQRTSIVEQGLIRTGVRVVRLKTEELIELFYQTFNPSEESKPIELTKE